MGVRAPICDVARFVLQGPFNDNYLDLLRIEAKRFGIRGWIKMSSTPSPNPEDLRRYYGLVIGNQKQLRDFIQWAEWSYSPGVRKGAATKVKMLVELRDDIDELKERKYLDGLAGFEMR